MKKKAACRGQPSSQQLPKKTVLFSQCLLWPSLPELEHHSPSHRSHDCFRTSCSLQQGLNRQRMKSFPQNRAALPFIIQRSPSCFFPCGIQSWTTLVLDFRALIYLTNIYIVFTLCQTQNVSTRQIVDHHPVIQMTKLRLPS